jgi:hypothetical protein
MTTIFDETGFDGERWHIEPSGRPIDLERRRHPHRLAIQTCQSSARPRLEGHRCQVSHPFAPPQPTRVDFGWIAFFNPAHGHNRGACAAALCSMDI